MDVSVTQAVDATAHIREMLVSDGYELFVGRGDGGIVFRIEATAQACAECLVPRATMHQLLVHALGAMDENIHVKYPGEME